MIRLIGIDGDKGAGKDTLAEALIRQFKFTRVPFAQPLKDILSEVYIIPPASFEDRATKDAILSKPIELTPYHINRILEEIELRGQHIPDKAIHSCLNLAGTNLESLRALMQFVGTDMVRNHVGYDTWVNLWCKEQAKYDRVVAPDARFHNERDAITVRKGKNVLIVRPGTGGDGHISENNHGKESDYDVIVTNTTNKVDLQSQFGMWYTTIKDR